MQHKLITLAIIWLFVIVAYIILAVAMPAFNEIVDVSSTDLAASANMSRFPGTQEMVDSSPVWIWFLPGLAGLVISTFVLIKGK